MNSNAKDNKNNNPIINDAVNSLFRTPPGFNLNKVPVFIPEEYRL